MELQIWTSNDIVQGEIIVGYLLLTQFLTYSSLLYLSIQISTRIFKIPNKTYRKNEVLIYIKPSSFSISDFTFSHKLSSGYEKIIGKFIYLKFLD